VPANFAVVLVKEGQAAYSKSGGAERTRTVIVFLDREVHTPFCHGPGLILDLGLRILDFGSKSTI
jgi:hypothetical protein